MDRSTYQKRPTHHTPGPWKVSYAIDAKGNPGWRVDSATRALMAVMMWPTQEEATSQEARATAKLVAAAPQLLAAIQDALYVLGKLELLDVSYAESVLADVRHTLSDVLTVAGVSRD